MNAKHEGLVNEKTTAPPPRPSGDMLTAHLLALLKGWSAYGYELARRLEQAGFGEMNKGSIYRLLRQMERSGLVSSSWDTTADGPARRIYSLTDAGNLFLNNWLIFLDAHRRGLEQLAALAGGLAPPHNTRKGSKKS